MTISVSVNSPSPSPQTPVSPIPSPTSPPNNLLNINNSTTVNNNSASGNSSNDSNGNGNPPAKRKASRRANTAERRATHNAVERQRRETLNSRFLDLAALLPNLATVRRPSKSAIVNSSIALIHSHRRARALAGRELRALDEETHALRREINEWRARARATAGSGLPHLPPLQPPQRSSEFLALISESTNIDEKIIEEEERRAYLLAEGAPADGDYDPEDSDDVNGDWASPGHNMHSDGSINMPIATSPSTQQPQWQAAALQIQYAQAMQQAQAQALQQQTQMQTIGSIGNINMGTGMMTMGMPSANGGNPLSVGPLGIMGVGLGQGQSSNATAPAPTWSAHPHSHSHPSFSHTHSHSNPHSPADSQTNPFAFTLSGNGLPDTSLHNQQQYAGSMSQNFMNNNSHLNGNGYNGHNQRTPPSTTASVSSTHDDDGAGGSSPRSVGNMSNNGGDSSSMSIASTPSPIVPGRQTNGNMNGNSHRNGSGNRNRNVNLNLNMNAGAIGSMKTGWGLVGPHSIPNGMTGGNVSTNMLGMGMGMNMGLGLGGPGSDAGVSGMGIVPVAGMIL